MYSPGQAGPIPNGKDRAHAYPQGFRYFSGCCLGETTQEIFGTESRASCCWVIGEGFIAVDLDLTRGVICYNSPDYTAALSASQELETYPLWSPNTDNNPRNSP